MKIGLLAAMRENCDNQFYYPLGLGYLKSYAEKFVKDTEIKIFKKLESLIEFKPDMAGLSSPTVFFDSIIQASDQLRKELNCTIIIGGPHITYMPSSLPESADLGVIGEGEITFLETIKLFLKKKKPDLKDFLKINGLIFRNGNNKIQTKPRNQIDNLDEIPYPVRDWEDFESNMHWSLTTRGCHFKCAYCSTSKFWGKTRFHSASYVVGELKEIMKYSINNGHIFADDLFCADLDRIGEIASLLKKSRNINMLFSVHTRADMMTDKLCKSLIKIGASKATYGLESGSDRILSLIKRGKSTVSNNQKALDLSASYGLKNYSFFMLGIPGETEQDMKDTCSFIDKNMQTGKLESFRFFPFVPYPGTKMWNEVTSSNIIDINKSGFKWSNLDIDSDFFDHDRYIYVNKSAPKSVFLKYYRILNELYDNSRIIFRKRAILQ